MPRGNGKQAQQAQASGKLAAFIKPKSSTSDTPMGGDWIDWGEVNAYYVVGAIKAVVREGGALLLGCSRDKTQYSVKVYAGGEGTAYYFRATPQGIEELEGFLLALSEIHGEGG